VREEGRATALGAAGESIAAALRRIGLAGPSSTFPSRTIADVRDRVYPLASPERPQSRRGPGTGLADSRAFGIWESVVFNRPHPHLLAAVAAGTLSLNVWAAGVASLEQPLTQDARQVYEWVAGSHDNQGLPFVIIDKRQAHLWVFDAGGREHGNAPVLLGAARGDHSVPGIGEMKLSQIRPEDRTTPAGRFKAEVGHNLRGETVVWVDYDGGVSMHPVLTTEPSERREQRLATSTPADNRVSYGCINVPKAFHQSVVLRTIKGGHAMVYVLPETKPVASVFPQLVPTAASRAGPPTYSR
jgi:hypothetical protein